MNTLRITLLLSTLMLPGLAFSVGKDSSDVSLPGADQKIPQNIVKGDGTGASHETPEPTVVGQESESNETDRGNLETPSENSGESSADSKSLLEGVAAWVYWPVGLAVGRIDWIADKAFVLSSIRGLAALKYLKGNSVGSWLSSHDKELSRAVVAVLIGSALYYYWKKCQECNKQAQDEKLRIQESESNSEDEENFGEFLPKDDDGTTKSV